MLLTPPDAIQFFKLHRTLMFFVNQRLGVLAGAIATPDEFAKQPPKNGLMMDMRRAPREAQEIAFEKGLMPYIPADRKDGV